MSKVVTGVEALVRGLNKKKAKDSVKVAEGLKAVGKIILKRAKYLCPKDTRALVNSGTIIVTGSGLGARVQVIFGGVNAPYGLYVHEDMEAEHKSPTQAKYVEKAVRDTRSECSKAMGRAMAGEILGHAGSESNLNKFTTDVISEFGG